MRRPFARRLTLAAFTSLFIIGIGLQISSCGPGGVASERSPGEIAYRNSCQSCHSLPRPSMKPDSEWPSLVARYGQKAKLNEEKIKLITEYLIAAN